MSAYVSGAAISDVRIEEDDGRSVTIRYKDYRNGKQRVTEKMGGAEFARRFVMHFLPRHCKRIRYAGPEKGIAKRWQVKGMHIRE